MRRCDRIILFMLLFLISASFAFAEQYYEDDNYIISCDKSEYKVFGLGNFVAYCNVTKKAPDTDTVKIYAVMENPTVSKVSIVDMVKIEQNLSAVDKKQEEKVSTSDIATARGTGLKIEDVVLNQTQVYQFKLNISYDQFGASDEFWITVDAPKSGISELDPLITGCTNDSATVYCHNGTFTGDTLSTSMNISIYNATIDGHGTSSADNGLVSLTSTGGWITILNSTLDGGGYDGVAGGSGSSGSAYIQAQDGYVNITNSLIYGDGGTSDGGFAGGQSGAISVFVSTYNYIDDTTIHASGTAPHAGDSGSGGTSIKLFNGTNITMKNVSITGNAGGTSIASGGASTFTMTSTIGDISLSDFSITSNGGSGCSTCAYDAGDSTTTITSAGNFDMYSATITSTAGSTGSSSHESDGGDAIFIVSTKNFTMDSSSSITADGGSANAGVDGSSKMIFGLIGDYLSLENSALAGDFNITGYHQMNFTENKTDYYFIWNSTSVTEKTTLYCENTTADLWVINYTAFDDDFTIDSSCNVAVYGINASNVSILPTPAQPADDLTCYYTYEGFYPESGTTIQWFNGSTPTDVYNETLKASNTSNNEKWWCQVNISDGTLVTTFNTENVTIGDTTAPSIFANATDKSSYYSDESATITVNCTDTGSSISWVRYTVNESDNTIANYSMSLASGYEWTDSLSLAVGDYNITDFWCMDTSGNLAGATGGLEFSVTARPASTTSEGGGGGAVALSCEELGWSILTTTGKTGYSLLLPKSSARPRCKNLVLKNEGEKSVTIRLTPVNSSITQYIDLKNRSFILEANEFLETYAEVCVNTIPDSSYGDIYTFEIEATDGETCKGILSFKTRISWWGNIFRWRQIGFSELTEGAKNPAYPVMIPAMLFSLAVFSGIVFWLKKLPIASTVLATILAVIAFIIGVSFF